MSKKLENIQLQFQKRNARAKGPTSSRDYNDSIEELGYDLASFRTQWNDRLVKLTAVIPDGTGAATDVNAFDTGLDGRTLYVVSEATLNNYTTYFNTTKNRPNTIWEQMTDIYGDLAELREDLENQIANNTLTASDIPIKDAQSLYLAGNVEDALAEIGAKVDNLSGIGAGGVEQVAFFTSVGTVQGTNEFSWDNTAKQLNITGDARVQHLRLQQRSVTPGATAGQGKLYTKTDDKLYFLDAAGVEHPVDIDPSDDFAQSGVAGQLTYWETASGITGVSNTRFDATVTGLFIENGTTFHPSGAGARSIAIGYHQTDPSLSAANSILIGTDDTFSPLVSQASGTGSISIGHNSRGTGVDSITIGQGNWNPGLRSIMIGRAMTTGHAGAQDAIQIGNGCYIVSTTDWGIAIGTNTFINTNMDEAIVIGRNAAANHQGGIAIGGNAACDIGGNYGIAIGNTAKADGDRSIVIGTSAHDGDFNRAVAIGWQAHALGDDHFSIGSPERPYKLTTYREFALSGITSPATMSGYGQLFVNSVDDGLYFHDSSGTETRLDIATLSGLNDTTISSTTSGQILEYNGSTWVNVDHLIGPPTSGDYVTSGFSSLEVTTKLADAIQTLNQADYTLATLVATPPGLLTGQNLVVGGTTLYSAKLPSGLSGAWGGYTPGATITSLIVDNTYTLTTPDSSTRFWVGLDSNPEGTVVHVEDASDGDSRAISAGTGTTGKLTVSAIVTHNTVWKRANAYITDTQSDGVRTHAIRHDSKAGVTNTTTLHYDSINTSPTFGSGISVGVITENLKYLSGIAYYTDGSQFRVQGLAASGIFEQAYHSTNVGRIDITGESNFAVNPAGVPNVGDTFAIDETRTVGLTGTEVYTNPTCTLRLYKPNGATTSEVSGLLRDFLTTATNSNTTDEPFTDEARRLVLGTDTAWTASGVLTSGNAQQYLVSNSARLAHSDEHGDYSFGGADSDYERKFTAVSRSNGYIDHTNVTSISALGAGTVNMFLYLATDDVWFDLGLVAGSNNGDGSGDSIANSKGARITSASQRTNFSLGTYNTGDNGNEFRLRVRFRATGASIINLSYSDT